MGRKVVLATASLAIAVMSVVLVGGQVGGDGGFLWWGNHEPIYIYGDDGFTVENGVLFGTGTAEDPYVIEGWRIDAPNADYGIYIDHTTKHFVIRDCVIERARLAGLYFNTVKNGRIEEVQVGLSGTAVYFLNSRGNELRRSVIAECRYGVVMAAESRDNEIVGNTFLRNGLSGHDPQRRNLWFEEDGGNYWSDYDGHDADDDGIGDVPYYSVFDLRPLTTPPAEWTRVAPAGLTYAGNQVAPDGSLVVSSETPITLASIDPGSGLSAIHYAIDHGDWVVYSGPIYLQGTDGPKKLSYYGVDQLGNIEPKQTISLFLDNHPPQTVHEIGEPNYNDSRGLWITSSSRITLRLVQQSTYGQTQTFYQIDGRGWQRYSVPFTVRGADGPHQITYYSRNASGVTEPTRTLLLYKDDTPPNTRGSQASSSIGVTIGESGSSAGGSPETEPPPIEEPPFVEGEPALQEPEPVIVPGMEESSEPSTQTPSGSAEF